jgi:hypothetical protein
MHQVRRGEDAGAVAGLQQDGLKHRAGRAFAVGAGHRDDGAVKGQAHALGHGADARQAHVDADGVQVLAVGQPVVEGFQVLHTAPIVALSRRARKTFAGSGGPLQGGKRASTGVSSWRISAAIIVAGCRAH